MAILRDDDARFQYLERKVGVFVTVAFAAVLVAMGVVGARQEWFTPKTRLHFITDTGRDLSAGMAVKLSGFDIGKVERLALTDNAKVRVTLAVKSEYMKWIRSDSMARLQKEGVIGANVIEIEPGTEAAKALTDDAVIPFGRARGLGEVVEELYGQVVPLLDDLKRLVRSADTLVAGLPATREKLDVVLDSAARNLKSLEKVTASDLPAISRSGRETVEGAKKVMESLSQTWPISSNIEPPRGGLVPQDSYGARAPKPAAP